MPDNSYTVLARRYRPAAFEEVVGQEHVAVTLRNAISENRVGHAYLFSGPRGVGKTSMARILAQALNCEEGPTIKPCGKCGICVRIHEGGDTDVNIHPIDSPQGFRALIELFDDGSLIPIQERDLDGVVHPGIGFEIPGC